MTDRRTFIGGLGASAVASRATPEIEVKTGGAEVIASIKEEIMSALTPTPIKPMIGRIRSPLLRRRHSMPSVKKRVSGDDWLQSRMIYIDPNGVADA